MTSQVNYPDASFQAFVLRCRVALCVLLCVIFVLLVDFAGINRKRSIEPTSPLIAEPFPSRSKSRAIDLE